MSSSYLSLKNLADSLEVYRETFKAHDNREEIGYNVWSRFCPWSSGGSGFALATSCTNDARTSELPLVKGQMERFVAEVSEDIPASNVCPRLRQRIEELREKRLGRSELEIGWFVVSGGKDQVPVNWSAQELEDCIGDLKKLARDIIGELDERYENSFSDRNKLLSTCFDFASLFTGLCGTHLKDKAPVDNRKFSDLGAAAFGRCVNYASQLPGIQNKNLEMCSELSSMVFCRFKKILIEIVWGTKFSELFSQFFKKIMASTSGNFTLQDLVVPNGVAVKSFRTNTTPLFCSSTTFKLELGNGEKMEVLFDKEEFIRSPDTDSSFYIRG